MSIDRKNETSNSDGFEFHSLPTEEEYARRGRLLSRFLENESRGREKSGSRVMRSGALALAVLGLATGVATAAGLFSKDDVAVGKGITCYAKASTESNSIGLPTDPDPVSACAHAWRQGVVTTDPLKAKPVAADAVPSMVACVSKGDGVSVFPGAKLKCEKLGMQPLPSFYAGLATRNELTESILQKVSRVVDQRPCVSPGWLRSKAMSALSRNGVAEDIPVIGSKPCANYATTLATGSPQIETLSRSDSRKSYLLTQALRVQGRYDSYTDRGCVDAQDYAQGFRAALKRSGLQEVTVRLDDAGGSCLDQNGQVSNWAEPAIDLSTR